MRRLIGRTGGGEYHSLEVTTPAQKEAFQAMLKDQSPPRALTDRELFEDKGPLLKQFGNQRNLDLVLKGAKEQGFTPGPNDVYLEGLARSVGDPLAFVPATGGYNHVKKVQKLREAQDCRKLEREAKQKPVLPRRRLEAKMREVVAADPAKAYMKPADLREHVSKTHFHQ